jgi:hypothetical protein
MSASYAKLRSGEWGIRSTEPISAGQRILVSKKSGEASTETVDRIVYNGDGFCLASIKKTERCGNASKPSNGALSQYCQSPRECKSAAEWDAPDRLCLPCLKMYDRNDGF